MATHSRILAWRIPVDSLVGYSPWGHKESDMTERLSSAQHTEVLRKTREGGMSPVGADALS